MTKQFKREVAAITNIISAMLETEAQRAVELEAKLNELEHFQNHRLQVKGDFLSFKIFLNIFITLNLTLTQS